jgi:hypothetical protein
VRWTPHAELMHEESATRLVRVLRRERVLLRKRWARIGTPSAGLGGLVPGGDAGGGGAGRRES